MAPVVNKVRKGQPARDEAFVEEQIHRAVRRIRFYDTSAALLGLAILILAYCFGMVLLDRLLGLSFSLRLLSFSLFLLGLIAYGTFFLVRPLIRRVNPYYAARLLEGTVPGIKNSIINWLDLRERNLPPAIRSAVGARAAGDLAEADLDQAVSSRRLYWLGGIAAALVLGGIVLLASLGFGNFLTFLGRAFLSEGKVGPRHRITLIEPAEGHATVPANQSFTVIIDVAGKPLHPDKPGAPRLVYRYNDTEPVYEDRPMEPDSEYKKWQTRVPPFQVRNGFWYKIVAGDAQTPEYRVQVRANPLITGFEATYHFPKYTGKRDEVSDDPNLKALQGTTVDLVVRTNRDVQSGRISFDGSKSNLDGRLVAGEPEALKFTLRLEKDTVYRVSYLSRESEAYHDPKAYTIKMLPDRDPQVAITSPAPSISLPANGLLQVEGFATDDFGIAGMALAMQVKNGPAIPAKKYRDGKSFRLAADRYPRTLDYKDAVALDKLTDALGLPVPLRAGMEIEYWLEATDCCEFPAPHTAQSVHQRVIITDPDNDLKKQEELREEAGKAQKEHERLQDQKLAKENQAILEEQKPPSKLTPEELQEQKDLERKRQELNDLLKQKENQPGEAKPEEKPVPQGNAKDPPKPENPDKPGEDKPKPQPDQKNDAGKGKDEGKPQDNMDKGDGKPQPQQEPPKGDGKPQQQPDKAAGDGKDKGMDNGMGDKGEAKGAPGQQAGEGKDGGKPDGQPDKAEAKGDGKDGKPGPEQQAGTGKGEPAPPERGEPKGNGNAMAMGEPEGMGKDGGAKGNGPAAKGEPKEGAGNGTEVARGKGNDAGPAGANANGNAGGSERMAGGQGKPSNQGGAAGECKGGGGPGMGGVGTPKGPGQGESTGFGNGKGTGDPTGAGMARTTGPAQAAGSGASGAVGGERTGELAGSGAMGADGTLDPELAHHRRAGELQLEEFKKRITPEMLKEANIAPEDFDKFLQSYRAMLKRHEAAAKEDLAAPITGGNRQPDQTPRRVERTRPDKPDAVENAGAALPPPEYKNAYKEFTEELSRLKRPK